MDKNGMAHFAPMMRLEAPQLNIGNPFKDYIAQAIVERELELKENELGLKEKGLGLDEQKLAYGAANDEAQRLHDIELAELKAKGERDNINYKYSLIQGIGEKEKNLEDGAWDYVGGVLKEYKEIAKNHNESGNIDPMVSFDDYIHAHPKFKAAKSRYGYKNINTAAAVLGQQMLVNRAVGALNIGSDGTYSGKSNNLQNEDDPNDW
ncbi:hypothetical protein CVIC8964_1291 [Campylobacter vicugnae]|uniref:Uncharacterized protein n=1 Tax=Campylobacter vicugnae TaxID=1660076 RepID=A0A1X9T2E3_9BACT|nr:hypothetical protein [Campylobacter sp. RM8964]ARR02680.1 hypothetical protein CVIC8964_1291 [Campylobacter sp. RM8964]